jgi:UTP--glucose-1-phosphate uridylyltransferase
MIAIVPAAGRGTRMSGISSGSKELLPVGDKSAIEWGLDEATSSGISEIVVVASHEKPDLLRFLDTRAGLKVAIQDYQRGLADAILISKGLRPSLVILPDTVFFPSSPSPRLVQALNRGFDMAIAVERVHDEMVSRYGIVEWSPENGRIGRILEKPPLSDTWSRWSIAARFALSVRTLMFVRERVLALHGRLGEIDLPPLLNEAIQAGHTGVAVPLESDEQRLDCGSPEGYLRACEVMNAGL